MNPFTCLLKKAPTACLAGLFIPWLACAQTAMDLTEVIDFGNIFDMAPAEFLRAVNTTGQVPSFDWVSQENRRVARFPKWQNSPPVSVWNLKIWESLASFNDNSKLEELTISFYNKGDVEARAGRDALLTDKESFVTYFRKVNKAISRWARSKGKMGKTETMLGNSIKTHRMFWVKEPHYVAELKWSYSDDNNAFLGEYINLSLTPLSEDNDPRVRRIVRTEELRARRPSSEGLTENIRKNFRGDVYLDNFPMVDQGAKGYCVAATLERILKYYGSQTVDQHLLAQMGGARGLGGTQLEHMIDVLKRGSVKLGVKVKTCYESDLDVRDFERLVKYYNRMAEKMDKEEIQDEVWITRSGRTISYDISKAYQRMDWEVFKEMKTTKEKIDYRRFLRDIHTYIGQGQPLTWSIIVGKVPEPNLKQTLGFHMRTIIGYNDKEEQVIYTDSWGPGHEFKKMPYADAWSITTHLHTLLPRH